MTKSVAGIILVVLVIIGAGAVILAGKNKDTATNTTTTVDHSKMDMSSTTNQSQTTDKATQPTSTVDSLAATAEIKNYAFAPATIKIKKGGKVTWTNQDSVKHDITPDQASDNFKGSELLARGETYAYTFNTVGTYTYHCSPHPYMKGTIEVTE